MPGGYPPEPDEKDKCGNCDPCECSCGPTCTQDDPAGDECPVSSQGPIRYGSGEIDLAVRDLSSGGFGQRWGHTRTYRNRMAADWDYGNGYNWLVQQWPYLTETSGTIVVVRAGAGSLWFDPDGSGNYIGRYGILEQLTLAPTGDYFQLTSPDGGFEVFHSFTPSPNVPAGAFSQQNTPGGDPVVLNYADFKPAVATRLYTTAAGQTIVEEYRYAYGSGADAEHITSATLRRRIGSGPWFDVRRALYAYYQISEPYGSLGDLKAVVHQAPADGLGWRDEATYYYRYYAGEPGGPLHGLKYVVQPEAFRRLAAAVAEPFAASDEELAPFADHYFEYDAAHRVIREATRGGSQNFSFAYAESGFGDGPNTWKFKTTETLPDGSQRIVYCNHLQQTMLSEVRNAAGTERWITAQQFNADYQVTLLATPAAIDLGAAPVYDPAVADLAVALRPSAGLIETNEYVSSGAEPGYRHLKSRAVQQGAAGVPVRQLNLTYGSQAAGGVTIYPTATRTLYRDDTASERLTTEFAYTFHAGTNQVLQKTTTLPEVPALQNGPGASAVTKELFNLLGQRTWEQGPRGVIDHFVYDPVTGAQVQQIQDVDPTRLALPAGWTRPTTLPSPLHLVTDSEHDALGRPVQVLGPLHDVDGQGVRTAEWTVYRDAEHATYSARGFVTGTGLSPGATLVNPVTIRRRDADGRPLDSIQAVRASTAGRLCASNEFPQATWVRWTREVYDDYDRLVATRAYHTLPAAGEGLPGTNYDETSFGYDVLDRRNRVRTPAGTITRTTFDVLGRPTGTWVGTSDAGATDADPAGGGAAGNNLRQVAAQVYPGGCDCVQPASLTQFVDAHPANNRVTSYVLDFRNRVVGVAGELGFYELRQYDNLDQLTLVERYDGASGPLLARSETFYDNRGRMYRTKQYAVSGGVAGNALEANTWYDAAQNPVKQVAAGAQDGRACTKHAYDGLGRLVASYQGYYTGALPEPYADVGQITANDKLFEQTLTTFDPAGNLLTTAFYQRLDDATGTGLLELPSGPQPRARVSYRAGWFDGIGRPVATADYGTHGDAPLVRPPVPPARSDTVLVTSQTYDPAGNPVETLDPAGRRARQAFDALNRLTESISHATDGCPGDDHDVTVRYAYDADGHLAALTAVNPTTGDQTTRYQYGTTLGDSALASRELLRSVVYPDSTGGDDRVTYAYNRQGQVTRLTDPNGTVHDYAYDRLGRPVADAASALGPGIDGAVRRLGREYDPLGRVLRVTSYSAASGGSVVNQVEWAYNGLGQPTAEYQAHGGSVNQATSPQVQTAYADGGQNTARPTALTYPSGRVVGFSYGAAGGDGDRLSRVASLDDAGPAPRVQYTYLGLGTIVRAVLPEPVIRWTLQNNASSTNPYPGLDRFGRVVENAWMTGTTGGTAVDQVGYSYDRMGNRTRRLLSPGSENSEVYRYDGLNRLTDMARGLINAHSVPAANFAQSWSLDATGNWSRFSQTEPAGGASQNFLQSRESNRANEIVDIAATYGPSWFVPVYDRAGNMIGLPRPESPTNHRAAGYDAWNRLVTVNLGTWTYAYDALHRRITSTAGSNQRHYYYSASWQVLEERLGTSPDTAPAERQFVWGLRYLDDCVLRDRSPTNNGVLSERLYALQDANWNVTSLVNPAGTVQERYRYAAYGQPTFLSAAFVPLSPNASAFDWETLYCGYRYDRSTGLYQVRYRYLHPGMGCWLTRDPFARRTPTALGEYAAGNPTSAADPLGLEVINIPSTTSIVDASGTTLAESVPATVTFVTDPAGSDRYTPPGGTPTAGTATSVTASGWVNCVGYACDTMGATRPFDDASVKQMLETFGYSCTAGVGASDCKSKCKQVDCIVIYIYRRDSTAIQPPPMNLFSSPWKPPKGVDFHAIKGEPTGYSSVPGIAKADDLRKVVDVFAPDANRPEYFDANRILEKACCCKNKQ